MFKERETQMPNKQLITDAIEAIGTNERDDYVINPIGHALEYKDKAPELAAILNRIEIKNAAVEYVEADDDAVRAQEDFKKQSKYARRASLWTTALSAALAISAIWPAVLKSIWPGFATLEKTGTQIPILAIAFASAVAAGFASICLNKIQYWKLLEKWMEFRAIAESKRLAYFYRISEAQSTPTSSPKENLFKFEYFRRFQLDVQIAYYKIRSKDHERDARKYLNRSIYSLGCVMLLNVVIGAAGACQNFKLTAFAIFSLFLQSLANSWLNTESVNQHRRNAERYKRTQSALERIKQYIDDVREKLEAGDLEVLQKFIEAVNEPISVEHRQWLASFDERNSATGRLEQQLNEGKTLAQP